MSKEIDVAAEYFALKHSVHDCPACGEDTVWEHTARSFKSGWKAALSESPEVRELVEALKWYGAHSTAREALAAYKKSVGV